MRTVSGRIISEFFKCSQVTRVYDSYNRQLCICLPLAKMLEVMACVNMARNACITAKCNNNAKCNTNRKCNKN